jgi:hypothetical protein
MMVVPGTCMMTPSNVATNKFGGMIYMLLKIIALFWIIGFIIMLIVKQDKKTGAYQESVYPDTQAILGNPSGLNSSWISKQFGDIQWTVADRTFSTIRFNKLCIKLYYYGASTPTPPLLVGPIQQFDTPAKAGALLKADPMEHHLSLLVHSILKVSQQEERKSSIALEEAAALSISCVLYW